ncbi:Sacsin [Geodia barretti]|uniref:Sacsin n=1 Tax=Geodia barretti TaxID=519541 RepID=A0AA35QSA3_GEOBA|nr:Sacsin [Geodia barretti]
MAGTFGLKQPPLYVSIQKILNKYPDGQIFKEIIQNADDAGATAVHFYLDSRKHGTDYLVEPKLATFQGPALLAYNDAVFTDDDWQSIQRMQQSSKVKDPFKVGKFGIGFNSVYHITDLPTIMSGSKLAYLEPHEEIWKKETVSVREKRVSSQVYTIDKLREILTALREEARDILLFLRSVTVVEVHEISDGGDCTELLRVSSVFEGSQLQLRSEFHQQLRAAFERFSYDIVHPIERTVQFKVNVEDFIDPVNSSESEWLVASRVGSPSSEVHRIAKALMALPWVGVALESTESTAIGGRVFCVLPMPSEVSCHLPVHVNATFSLNDERRELKWAGVERKNDPSADWNGLIIEHLLPPCYAGLLLGHVKELFTVEDDSSDWPILVESEGVVYTDNDFLRRYIGVPEAESYKLVNKRIPPQMARLLRLKPLSEFLDIAEDAFEDIGQHEPLTVRLKNILKDYKDGLTIIKELLQNADDAGATEVNICYDARNHRVNPGSLLFPGMASCHGPALVVHNNAMFTQEDFKNITKLAGATKEGKALKIGKFGVGFCSVYHMTDVPSFISNNFLYIFDPTLACLKDDIKNPAQPGKKVTHSTSIVINSQQLAPYQGLFGFQKGCQYEGTMFRFPFRTTPSDLSSNMYNSHTVKQIFEGIQNKSSELLLFLQSVKCIKVHEINDVKTGLPVHISSNFAVTNNRTGLWTSDDRSTNIIREVQWNESLMKTVIPKAYFGMLASLKQMSLSSQVKEYLFYKLWPLGENLTIHNPWKLMIDALYQNIQQSDLFFSTCANEWLALSKGRFLSPDGNRLRKCCEVVNPKAQFAGLFDEEEGLFPIKEFHEKPLVSKAMEILGIVSSHISMELLKERARTVAFTNECEPKDGGCGRVSYAARNILRIRDMPTPREVVEHFVNVISVYSSQSTHNESMVKVMDNTVRLIYSFLENALSQQKSTEMKKKGKDHSCKVDISQLLTLPCIWTGRRFVRCERVAMEWKSDTGPCLYKVPDRHNVQLWKELQIKPKFSIIDFIRALQEISEEHCSEMVSDAHKKVLLDIVSELVDLDIPKEHPIIMLPDKNFVMHDASSLAFNDAQWLPPDKEIDYVNHKLVTRDLAQKLGVRMVRSKVVDTHRSSKPFESQKFGQREKLTTRIQGILKDYPFDVTILKELLQNADDAKASKMIYRVPALLVWNDSVFSETDIEGIQKLGIGTKPSDADTIGQYGIGFNSVYHLTDCPSFISAGNLCVFDPHCKFSPGSSIKHPGGRFKVSKGFWSDFPDMIPAYLQCNVEGGSECREILGGSLFRFPLRHTRELVDASEIVCENEESKKVFEGVLTASRMQEYLHKWAPQMKQSMYFLNHVTELKFFVISQYGGNHLRLEHHYRVGIDDLAAAYRKEIHQKLKSFNVAQGAEPFVTKYQLTLTEMGSGKEMKEKWLIQQGVGDIHNKQQEWKYIARVKPRHGIAVPLEPATDPYTFRGRVFCFLPLPLDCNLPVHIHGHFILHSNRRGLWTASEGGDTDSKHQWNTALLKAIASSYAQLLLTIKADYKIEGGVVNSKDVRKYYLTFPSWTAPRVKSKSDAESPEVGATQRAAGISVVQRQASTGPQEHATPQGCTSLKTASFAKSEQITNTNSY